MISPHTTAPAPAPPPAPAPKTRTRVALVSAVLSAAVTAVVTAVVTPVVPGMAATARSTVSHLIGEERSCGTADPTPRPEDSVQLDLEGPPVRVGQPVRISMPDIAGCQAVLATREPGEMPKIHGECTNPSDVPGRFDCLLQRSKLCNADSGPTKLVLWLSVFVVTDDGLEKLVSSNLLRADAPATIAAYQRFKDTLGRDRIGHYEKAQAISVDCRKSAPGR